MIVKPLDGHGGESIFLARADDRNLNPILEAVTRFESRPIMAQRYIPEVRDGDKRVILLDGEPLGGTLRVPRDDENRGNIHVGGNCVKADLTRATSKSAGCWGHDSVVTGSFSLGSISSATA